MRALFALAGFRNHSLIRRTLDLIEEREVRTQNAPYLLTHVLGNPEFGDFAWDWVKDHWADLTERFPDNSHHRMLEGLGLHTNAELAADAREFLTTHPVKAGQRSVTQTLERLDVNVAFAEREAASLATLFDE